MSHKFRKRISKILLGLLPNIFIEEFFAYSQKILYTTPYVHGPRERLLIAEDVKMPNVLFNTRSGTITIEERVIFGHNVQLLTGYHEMNEKEKGKKRKTITDANRDIMIKHGAWIASGVIIIGPSIIGENAIIGAGSVVVDNVPANNFYAGNPAQFKRKL